MGLSQSELNEARAQLAAALREHDSADAEEAADVAAIVEWVEAHADALRRSCLGGHVTGSAYVSHPDGSGLLLIYHRKLQRWLQPGGHMADDERSPAETALREAAEETGLPSLRLVSESPLDVDAHTIPGRKSEPEHTHFDVRYHLTTDEPDALAACEDETEGARWFTWAELAAAPAGQFDPAFLRAAGKVRAIRVTETAGASSPGR